MPFDRLDDKPDKIKGDTDDTLIGNVGDRLKVDANVNIDPSDTPGCPVFSDNYVSIVDETQVTLSGTYQTIYSYSGSGKFVGFVASYESSASIYRLTIDGNVIFADVSGTTYGLLDIGKNSPVDTAGGPVASADAKRIAFIPQCPIEYDTSVLIEAKDSGGKKHFRYIVNLTKET